MNALLYAANTVPQDVSIDGNINFGNTVRRYGKNIYLSGGNIITNGAGDYVGHLHLNFIGATGTTTITVMENGVPIPGAKEVRTTADATEYAVCIPFPVRNRCCNEKVISVKISGAAITDAVASILVEKVQ